MPTLPPALLLDTRLTPLERNAWMVFRVRVGADGLSALSSVAQLRPFLATTPLTPRAAFDTAMRAVTVCCV